MSHVLSNENNSEKKEGGHSAEVSRNERLRTYMKGFKDALEEWSSHGKRASVYNFGVKNFDASTIKKHLWKVFNNLEGKPVKVSFHAGFILQNNVTGNYKYFYPDPGTKMLATFRLISKDDFLNIVKEFENFDWMEWCHERQENTQSTAIAPMNLHIVTYTE